MIGEFAGLASAIKAPRIKRIGSAAIQQREITAIVSPSINT